MVVAVRIKHLDVSAAAPRRSTTGVTWFGWRVPTLVELAIVLVLGLAPLGAATFQFTRTE